MAKLRTGNKANKVTLDVEFDGGRGGTLHLSPEAAEALGRNLIGEAQKLKSVEAFDFARKLKEMFGG